MPVSLSPKSSLTGFPSFGTKVELDDHSPVNISPGSSQGYMGMGSGRGRGLAASQDFVQVGYNSGGLSDRLTDDGRSASNQGPSKSALSSPRKIESPGSPYSPKHISFAASPIASVSDPTPETVQDAKSSSQSAFQRQCLATMSPSEALSHFEVPARPLMSIPLESPLPQEFNAIITSIVSCTKFSVIPLCIEAKQALKKIAEFGAEVGHVPINHSEVTIGSKCGVKTAEGMFYRGLVESLVKGGIGEVIVKLLDFGAEVKVTCDQLITLSEDLITLPSIRRRCSIISIFGVVSSQSAKFLQGLTKKQPIRVKNHGTMSVRTTPGVKYTLCDITTLDGSADLSKVIASSQFILQTKDHPPTSMVPTEVSLSTSNAGKRSLQPDITGGTGTGQSMKSMDCSDQYKMVHYASRVPFHDTQPHGASFTILPTVVNSPSSIWAQVVHTNISNLYRLQHDMNAFYQESDQLNVSTYVPAVGEICAAKFPVDQKVYRAEILCVNHNGTVDVRYVDFGNCETVTVSQLRHLKQVYLTLPKQALLFSMVGVAPSGSSNWSDGAIAFLRERIMNKEVLVKVVHRDSFKCCLSVKISDPDSPKDHLNDSLVKLGHAYSVPVSLDSQMQPPSPSSPILSMPGVNVSQQKKSQSNMFSQHSPPFSSLPTERQGLTSETSPKKSSSLHLPLAWHQKQSVSLEDEARLLRKPAKPVFELGSHGYESLKSSDKHPPWKRLGSKETESEQIEPTTPSTPSDEETLKQIDGTYGALSMGRTKITPDWKAGRDVSCFIETPAKKTGGFDPSSKPISPCAGSPSPSRPVGVTQPDGTVSSRPLSFVPASQQPAHMPSLSGVGRNQEESSIGMQVPPPFVQSTPSSSLSPSKRQLKSVRLSENSGKVQAVVTHVDNPYSFYIQVLNKSALSALVEVSKEMNRTPLVRHSNPQAGELCVCRYAQQDGLFYRGQISLLLPNDKVKVQFVDYGSTSIVKLADIYEIDNQFLSLPAQAVLCTLNQLLNPNGRNEPWNADAVKFFKAQLSRSEVVILNVVKAFGVKNIVDVTIPLEHGEEDLLSLMVDGGFSGNKRGGNSSVKDKDRTTLKQLSLRNIQQQKSLSGEEHKSPFASLRGQNHVGAPRVADIYGTEQDNGQKTPFGEKHYQMSMDRGGGGTKEREREDEAMMKKHSPFAFLRKHPQPISQATQLHDLKDNPLTTIESPKLTESVAFAHQSRAPLQLQIPQQNWPRVTDLETVPIPSESEFFEVTVSEVEHPTSFFVQVVSKSCIQILNNITFGLNVYFQCNPPMTLAQQLDKHTVCCARFSEDNVWYRAEILDSAGRKGYHVRFIDFGNTDTVTLHNIAPCPESFLTTPIMAIWCALNGIAPPPQSWDGNQTNWTSEATAFLRKSTSNKHLLARVVTFSVSEQVSNSKQEPVSIELIDTSITEGIYVANELVKQGLAITKSAVASSVPSHCYMSSNLCIPQDILPKSSPSFKIMVSEVSNPGSFWVQQMKREHLTSLNSLMQELQEVYSNPNRFSRFSPETGAFCCAKYTLDNTWYRGKVLAIDKDNVATVSYIDFGTTERMPTHQLYALDPKFCIIP